MESDNNLWISLSYIIFQNQRNQVKSTDWLIRVFHTGQVDNFCGIEIHSLYRLDLTHETACGNVYSLTAGFVDSGLHKKYQGADQQRSNRNQPDENNKTFPENIKSVILLVLLCTAPWRP